MTPTTCTLAMHIISFSPSAADSKMAMIKVLQKRRAMRARTLRDACMRETFAGSSRQQLGRPFDTVWSLRGCRQLNNLLPPSCGLKALDRVVVYVGASEYHPQPLPISTQLPLPMNAILNLSGNRIRRKCQYNLTFAVIVLSTRQVRM